MGDESPTSWQKLRRNLSKGREGSASGLSENYFSRQFDSGSDSDDEYEEEWKYTRHVSAGYSVPYKNVVRGRAGSDLNNLLDRLRTTQLSFEKDLEYQVEQAENDVPNRVDLSGWVNRIKKQYEPKENDRVKGNSTPAQKKKTKDAPRLVRQWVRDDEYAKSIKENAKLARNCTYKRPPKENLGSTNRVRYTKLNIREPAQAKPQNLALFVWEKIESESETQDADGEQDSIVEDDELVISPKVHGNDLESIRFQAKVQIRCLKKSFEYWSIYVRRQKIWREELQTNARQRMLQLESVRLKGACLGWWRCHTRKIIHVRTRCVLRRRLGAWRQTTKLLQRRREEERTRRLQTEHYRDLMRHAGIFYHNCLKKRVWLRWFHFVRRSRYAKEQEREANRRRMTMDSFLGKVKQQKLAPKGSPMPHRQDTGGSLLQNVHVIPKSSSVFNCQGIRPARLRSKLTAQTERDEQSLPEYKVPEEKSQCSPPPPPPPVPPRDLTPMEKRTLERKKKREELRKRYEQQEKQRTEELQRMEKLAKEKQLKEREERLRKKRMDEHRLAKSRACAEERTKLGKLHRRRAILWYHGLKPWIVLVRLSKLNTAKANRHCTQYRVSKTFFRWRTIASQIKLIRRKKDFAMNRAAVTFRHRSLLRLGWALISDRHYRLRARYLAVRAQRKRNFKKHILKDWYLSLREELTRQRKLIRQFEQQKKEKIWCVWLKHLELARTKRLVAAEKKQTWTKVRSWLTDL